MKILKIKRYIFILICLIFIVFFAIKSNRHTILEKDYNNLLCFNEIMINNRNSTKDKDSDYENWVEVYNMSDKEINLNGFGITNNNEDLFKWKFPDVSIQPHSFLIVWLSGKDRVDNIRDLHTNFKIKPDNDILVLTSPDSSWNDILHLQKTSENISYGKKPDGIGAFFTFENGTPCRSNNIKTLIDGVNATRLDEPKFSTNGGLFNRKINLTLSTDEENSKIFYTLDGSEPTRDSLLYKDRIEISPKKKSATIVRAILYKDGYQQSNIVTHSYFVDESFLTDYDIPIVSIVTDPKNLFDDDYGIYVAGEIYNNWLKKNENEIKNIPSNYTQEGKKWERKAHVEIFEEDRINNINQNIGIRIFGGYSRHNTVKSLSLFARKSYDDKDTFDYEFSSDNYSKGNIQSLNKLVLRTPSTDYNGSFFRDDLIQSLIPSTLNIQTQKSQTCVVFINGQYYGLHSIKEAYNKNYFYSYYNIAEDDVVILKNPTGIAGIEVSDGFAGDEMHFNKLYSFIKNNDMANSENYEYVKTFLDVENFIEYNIMQIYCANRDWPGNNIKIWRKRTSKYMPDSFYGHDGRWRYLLFDLDYGLGLYTNNTAKYDFDMLKFATEDNGPIWPNPPWSTMMLRKLLENNEFREQFINTFADRLNTIYSENVVSKKITDFETLYSPYVKDHIEKWDIFKNDVSEWEKQVNILEEFAKNRPKYVRQHIINYFNLNGLSNLYIDVTEGGTIKINNIFLDSSSLPWKGIYFNDTMISAEAIPNEGYEFVNWSGDVSFTSSKINIKLKETYKLKATFKKLE